MSDIKKAYNEIIDFLNNETEKTLLLRGIADREKHQVLLKALNDQGKMKGLVNLINTTKAGITDFFRHAGLYNIDIPRKYGKSMRYSNMTIFFDNITTNDSSRKYNNYKFDFMIIWPIQSVTKNKDQIEMIKEMVRHQKSKKIIFLTLREPWYNPDCLEIVSDRVIELNCENDNPQEYNRIMEQHGKDLMRQNYF